MRALALAFVFLPVTLGPVQTRGVGGGWGGLEALPMIQGVTVPSRFRECKQNIYRMQGHLSVSTWVVVRFDFIVCDLKLGCIFSSCFWENVKYDFNVC